MQRMMRAMLIVLSIITLAGCANIPSGPVDQWSDQQVEQFIRQSDRVEAVYAWQSYHTNAPGYSPSLADHVRLSDPWCSIWPRHGFYSVPKQKVVLTEPSHLSELLDLLTFQPTDPCECVMETTFRAYRGMRFLEVRVSPHHFAVQGERFIKPYRTPKPFYGKLMSLKPEEETPNQSMDIDIQ